MSRRFLGLSQFQISLPGVGGLGGVHPGPQAGFFQEVAPAFVGVGRALTVLAFAHDGFGILPALDHLNDTGRHVGSDVVSDEGVGSS